MSNCPHCGHSTAPAPTTLTPRKTRLGGKQIAYGVGLRMVAHNLYAEGYVDSERKAQRVARRWLTAALPARQKAPRKRPADELREVA